MLSILSRTKWNDNNTSYWHTQVAFSVVSDCQALVVHFAARHIPFKPLLCVCHPLVNCLLYPVHSVCGTDAEQSMYRALPWQAYCGPAWLNSLMGDFSQTGAAPVTGMVMDSSQGWVIRLQFKLWWFSHSLKVLQYILLKWSDNVQLWAITGSKSLSWVSCRDQLKKCNRASSSAELV